MSNPLKQQAFEVSVQEEEQQRNELLETSKQSLMDLETRVANIDKIREVLEIDTKEKNVLAAAQMNQATVDIIRSISDPYLFQRIIENVETAYDLNNAIKAISEWDNLRMDLLRNIEDVNASNPNRIKIDVQFGKGVKFGTVVQTDD